MDIQFAESLWLGGFFLIGLLNCFFGYRLFIITVGIIGFVLGASCGYLAGMWLGNQTIALIAGGVLGLIGAWASVMGYYAFIFVLGGFGFALLAIFVVSLFNENAAILVAIVAGIIGAFLSLWLQRVIIIIATAAQGALAMVLAVSTMLSGGGAEEFRISFYRAIDGDLRGTGGLWYFVGLIAWLVLFIAGATAQFRRGKEMYRPRPRSAQ
jgi:hypothetical protein